MKKLLATLVVAGCAAAAAAPAHAISLTGDTIDVNLSTSFGGDFGTQSVLVGAGEDASYFGNQFFDFDAGMGDVFTIRSSSFFCGMSTCGAETVTVTLTGLDFGVPLTSFTILSSIGGATVTALTATSLVIEWAGTSIPSGIYFEGRFNGGPTSAVPLPGAAILLLTGLGAIGGLSLRRRKAA